MKRVLAVLMVMLMTVSLVIPSFAYRWGIDLGDGYTDRLSDFSARLYSLFAEGSDDDYVMSPVSVYFALALLHYAGDAGVKDEIEAFTGMSADDFEKTADLFESLDYTYRSLYTDEVEAQLTLSNSVWLDETASDAFDSEALEKMKEDLFCSIETAPFFADNEYANGKVKEFIKEKTKGLIDIDPRISAETLFALINTLYFKDIWDPYGHDLETVEKYFRTDGGMKLGDFLIGHYANGQIAETENSYFFYAETDHGYKVKFILPKDGYSLSDIMTPENVHKVNTTKDFGYIDQNGAEHHTRCVFPEFETENRTDMKEKLSETGALTHTFDSFTSHLLPDDPDGLAVGGMMHAAKLKVDKKGVEGAAVTVVYVEATSMYEEPRTEFYHDFIVNKNFGFLVTDRDDVILFEGQVKDPFEDKSVIPESELPAGIEERYDGTFALDIPNDDAYKADGVGGVRFDLKLGLNDEKVKMEIAAVEGAAQDAVKIVNNEDGTMTVEVTDMERIAAVPSGEALVRVVFTKKPFTYDLFAAREVLESFRLLSAEPIPAAKAEPGTEAEKQEEQPGEQIPTTGQEPKQLSKQTGDPVFLYIVLFVSSALVLALCVIGKKRFGRRS